MNDINRILVLAPHTDDGEFGCGGSIAKLSEMGKEVHYMAFSDCEKSFPSDSPPDMLIKALMEAAHQLSIPPSNVEVKKFEVLCFERDRQDIFGEKFKALEF